MNLPHIVRNYLDRRRIPYRLITCTAGDSLIQIAAQLAGAGPRQQVLDLCAGAGGKTLALAAAMESPH
jgi:ubiquinone/menaquinone biosynthesis C-methylase UbiE